MHRTTNLFFKFRGNTCIQVLSSLPRKDSLMQDWLNFSKQILTVVWYLPTIGVKLKKLDTSAVLVGEDDNGLQIMVTNWAGSTYEETAYSPTSYRDHKVDFRLPQSLMEELFPFLRLTVDPVFTPNLSDGMKLIVQKHCSRLTDAGTGLASLMASFIDDTEKFFDQKKRDLAAKAALEQHSTLPIRTALKKKRVYKPRKKKTVTFANDLTLLSKDD
jgi:hypothetical protein